MHPEWYRTLSRSPWEVQTLNQRRIFLWSNIQSAVGSF
ncbi:hypothetical protein [Sporolactobacillus inulinus]|nr:hypothetical protein [Sporolactobacillus inulinus]